MEQESPSSNAAYTAYLCCSPPPVLEPRVTVSNSGYWVTPNTHQCIFERPAPSQFPLLEFMSHGEDCIVTKMTLDK